jgi:hypothetical protein
MLEFGVTAVLLAMGMGAIYDWLTGGLEAYFAWKIVLGIGGLIGLYHLVAHILQKPLFGVSNILNGIGRRLFRRSLQLAQLSERVNMENEVEFVGGRMRRKSERPASPTDRLA